MKLTEVLIVWNAKNENSFVFILCMKMNWPSKIKCRSSIIFFLFDLVLIFRRCIKVHIFEAFGSITHFYKHLNHFTEKSDSFL